jgi:crotonobetainyl-CoA:carnitine CoA-transferase CaiB-like acyl-CoA transferase
MKTRSQRTAKPRKPRKLIADVQPLTEAEHDTLHDLIAEACASNHTLAHAGHDLEQARVAMTNAAHAQDAAHKSMAEAREESVRVHAQIAPLLHRLPA